MCKRFANDLSGRQKHGALKDCFLLADVYIELLGGKQTSLNLDKETKSSDNMQEKTKKTTSLAKTIVLDENTMRYLTNKRKIILELILNSPNSTNNFPIKNDQYFSYEINLELNTEINID